MTHLFLQDTAGPTQPVGVHPGLSDLNPKHHPHKPAGSSMYDPHLATIPSCGILVTALLCTPLFVASGKNLYTANAKNLLVCGDARKGP